MRNGLAEQPPMGWISWQRFGCRIDCSSSGWGPDECLSERLVKSISDRMVQDGYAQAGYSYINIDDCWANHDGRDAAGELVSDSARFPSGMAALSEYVHRCALVCSRPGWSIHFQ